MKFLKTNWLIKHSLTVLSCVLIIVLGITAITYATSIGEDISTNGFTATGLTVNGNATTTGNLDVAGDTILAGATLSGDLDLNGNELKNSVLEKLADFPSSPVEGQMFYNTASDTPHWYNGLRWKGDVSGATFVVAASDSLHKENANYICDGTDDQVEIKAAIDALPDTGGKVLLLEGTFYINSTIYLNQTDNNHYVTLEGQGDGTILTLPDGHSASMSIVRAQGANTSNVVQSPYFANFRIDGNSSGVTGTIYNGILAEYADNVVVENITMTDGGGTDGYGVIYISVTNSRISGLKKGTFAINSIELRSSDRVIINNCLLEERVELYATANNIVITENIFDNIGISLATQATTEIANNIQITNNYFYLTTSGHTSAIKVKNVDGILISGNYIHHTGYPGIYLADDEVSNVNIIENIIRIGYGGISFAGDNGQITGNYILVNSNSTGDGINNAGVSPSNWVISNNTIKTESGATASNGIRISAGSSIHILNNHLIGSYQGIRFTTASVIDSTIKGNIFSDTLYQKIINNGTNTTIAENVGWTTENSGTATITSGNTYIAISHGLEITPSAGNISVTPTNNLGAAGEFWISDIGATSFRINVDTDPLANATFSWNIGSY